jgi:hypothetical protein
MNIREIWRRIAPTRYVRVLEQEGARLRAEIDRLRAENRALLNSILGIAGVPPIPADVATSCAAPPLTTHPIARPGLEAPPSGPGASSRRHLLRTANGEVRVTAPLRRRSWQQINRMLEFESGRKAVAGQEKDSG